MTQYLIFNQSKGEQPAAAMFAESNNASSEEYGTIQDKFTQDNPQPELYYPYANMEKLWQPNSVLGIPYIYSLTPDGGMFTLFAFECHNDAQVDAAGEQLRRDQDVVSLTVKRVKLVDWEPTAPFTKTEKPSWIRAIAGKQERVIAKGDLVALKQPYKPEEFVQLRGEQWGGFTYGIVVNVTQEMVRTEKGPVATPRNVELHLYDAAGSMMIEPSYVKAGLMIPTYVAFHLSELVWYKRADKSGYTPIENAPDWSDW